MARRVIAVATAAIWPLDWSCSSKLRLLAVNERRGLDQCGQATKGTWGMSWHQKAVKGVEDCDKPGEIVKRVLIPGFPN